MLQYDARGCKREHARGVHAQEQSTGCVKWMSQVKCKGWHSQRCNEELTAVVVVVGDGATCSSAFYG